MNEKLGTELLAAVNRVIASNSVPKCRSIAGAIDPKMPIYCTCNSIDDKSIK